MTAWRFSVLALASALALSHAAWSQETPEPAPNAAADETWYRQQLLDLGEVLGGSHYLTTLCTGQGDQRWRDAMRRMMQREPQYSDDLVEAFNRGYGAQQRQYAVCDATAQQMATELRARGLRISQALAARHTN